MSGDSPASCPALSATLWHLTGNRMEWCLNRKVKTHYDQVPIQKDWRNSKHFISIMLYFEMLNCFVQGRNTTIYMKDQPSSCASKLSTATQDLQWFPAVYVIRMNGPLCLSLAVSFIHDLNQSEPVLQSAGRQGPKFITTFHCPALAYRIYDSINNNHSSRTPCHPLCPIATHLLHAQITSSHSAH